MAGPSTPEAAYIALEGPEGCGKSTQASRLAEHLGAVLTRETGGTAVGERLRAILHDVTVTDLDPRAEALMIAADRAQHLARVVRPALAAGRHVVSDRSVHSSLAYQGYGRGLPVEEVRAINEWALGGTWPALVVLLDVPPAEIERRLRSRHLDRFERESAEFHTRVADGFRSMAAADPERWIVIGADRPLEEVAEEIATAVDARLSTGTRP